VIASPTRAREDLERDAARWVTARRGEQLARSPQPAGCLLVVKFRSRGRQHKTTSPTAFQNQNDAFGTRDAFPYSSICTIMGKACSRSSSRMSSDTRTVPAA
jgi:hypothetical protein